jgi:hypothetical protein
MALFGSEQTTTLLSSHCEEAPCQSKKRIMYSYST